MGWQEFWGTIPRLVPPFLRLASADLHFIPVRFRPATPPAPDPYAGVSSGKKPRTALHTKLDHVQACLVADLNSLVIALDKAIAQLPNKKRRHEALPTLDGLLRSVFPGPSSVATLLRKGNVFIRERNSAWDLDYRAYLTSERADRLLSAGDIDGLKDLIAAHVTAIGLVGRALTAADATAKGLRKTLRDVARGNRFSDETIACDVLDGLPDLAILEMTSFSFESGVNASHIWQCYHGDPIAIDYHRVFDLAVFAGRLARGQPAIITWDLVRYILAHHEKPNLQRPWRVDLFPNTVPTHDAIEWIFTRIDASYGRARLLGGLIMCDQPGESRTFRLPPLSS